MWVYRGFVLAGYRGGPASTASVSSDDVLDAWTDCQLHPLPGQLRGLNLPL